MKASTRNIYEWDPSYLTGPCLRPEADWSENNGVADFSGPSDSAIVYNLCVPKLPDVLQNTVERKNFLPQVKAPHKLLTQ